MIIPALQTGMEFSDVGFRGDQTIGGSGFRDPWPTSRNQVGHFLTAVGLGFDSSSVTRRVLTRSIRDWLGADDSMSDEEVAMRLIIGHELAADPGFGLGLIIGGLVGGLLGGMPAGAIGTIAGGAAGAAVEVLNGFRDQFQQTTDQHVTAFGQALTTLGPGPVIDMSAAEPLLQPIISTMNLTLVGNSVQDLRLSLAGWKLGQDILGGSVSTGTDVASWVRSNLM